MSDELEGLRVAQCVNPECRHIAWIEGGSTRCPSCEFGMLRPAFHECERIGWHDWPHRYLHDGRLLALEPLLTGLRLHVVREPHDGGSSDVYEFPLSEVGSSLILAMLDGLDLGGIGLLYLSGAREAFVALHTWSGEGEPVGWYRHRPSNRRRPGGDPTKEEVRP